MVPDVTEDARGIIAPEAGRARFDLRRYEPSPRVARFVDRYWLARWNLGEPYVQRVFSHPVVNVVVTPDGAAVHGVATGVTSRRLVGAGWALGAMFRPAGFRPLLGRPMSRVRDAAFPLTELCGPPGSETADAVAGEASPEGSVAALEELLDAYLPASHHPAEDTAALVERAAADPAAFRVETLAARAGVSVRQLQRRFADHVGVGPKAVLRRYRLYEVAERVRRGGRPDWPALASELGYSDQSHLTRDFTAVVGVSPQRYTASRAARPAG
ncbi:AraC family transcriptional regulator [Haloactinospora alba]|uniref:AraC family transcriptional regulator n=1 Tax=Haloactinospora alba TaxID=405555 RepID=A0A543N9J5_9ACTN|nr:helix-turn-helix transcriptional regulator [Haloactinospora alba]TQN28487.1 AraC family transcriptional regulator [Haloactinospora alba]